MLCDSGESTEHRARENTHAGTHHVTNDALQIIAKLSRRFMKPALLASSKAFVLYHEELGEIQQNRKVLLDL
jgi:hypothetical protein